MQGREGKAYNLTGETKEKQKAEYKFNRSRFVADVIVITDIFVEGGNRVRCRCQSTARNESVRVVVLRLVAGRSFLYASR